MRIGFIYSTWSSAGYKYDFCNDNIYTALHGLNGSELSITTIAREIQKRNHQVTLFMPIEENSIGINWHGVQILPVEALSSIGNTKWDAIYAWNDPNVLRVFPSSVLRLCNLQVNDFTQGAPGYDNYVDIWTSPSDNHMRSRGSLSPSPHKWTVVNNGCDPSQYDPSKIIDGRIIWASSPDRGLHWLLSIWPEIKRKVPYAELRIFYRVEAWIKEFLSINTAGYFTFPEMQSRAYYIQEILRKFKKLGGLGVTLYDSVSRVQMAQEMSEAQILAYPCDTPTYTEGFSVTLLEGCASGTLPITTSVDALGEIYGGSVPMVEAPMKDHISEYKDLILKALTDQNFRNEWLEKSTKLSNKYLWPDIANKVERIIQEGCISRSL